MIVMSTHDRYYVFVQKYEKYQYFWMTKKKKHLNYKFLIKKLSCMCNIHLRETDALSGKATLSKIVFLPSEKGSTLKGKNLLPLGANSFLLE